jgi:Ni/Co efflux regulator RcnB
MRRWLIGWFLAFMLVALVDAHADERRRGHEQRGFPFSSEHWEGWRRWTPDRHQRRRGDLPDRFTIDKPGKCEVRCERSGRSYRCKEYRC